MRDSTTVSGNRSGDSTFWPDEMEMVGKQLIEKAASLPPLADEPTGVARNLERKIVNSLRAQGLLAKNADSAAVELLVAETTRPVVELLATRTDVLKSVGSGYGDLMTKYARRSAVLMDLWAQIDEHGRQSVGTVGATSVERL